MNDLSLPICQEILLILLDARAPVVQSVNSAMVQAYFQIGRVIVEDEQQGASRAEYGEATFAVLSKRLTEERTHLKLLNGQMALDLLRRGQCLIQILCLYVVPFHKRYQTNKKDNSK